MAGKDKERVQGFEGSGVQGEKGYGADVFAGIGKLSTEDVNPEIAENLGTPIFNPGTDYPDHFEKNGEISQGDQAELTDQANQVGVETLKPLKFDEYIVDDPLLKFQEENLNQAERTDQTNQANQVGRQVFSADLVMTAIRNTQHGVTFEVQNPEGFRITGLTHIQMDRKDFPIDDDFNTSFINAPFKEPKELVVKREGFKKYTKMRLVILMEG